MRFGFVRRLGAVGLRGVGLRVRAGQLAELLAVPLAHVGQVAIDLLPPLGHDALLLLELLGLLRQPLRRRGDLLGLLFDLGLAPLQARLVAGQDWEGNVIVARLPTILGEIVVVGKYGKPPQYANTPKYDEFYRRRASKIGKFVLSCDDELPRLLV